MFFLWLTMETHATDAREQARALECLLLELPGNTQALESVYARTKSAVYGFALSIVKNAAAAEDVMQEAYVRIYRSAPLYKPQGKPMAWILTITRNLALMKLRNENLPLRDDMYQAEERAPENSVERIVLKTALDELSEEERQIVILHSVAGLKHRELAELLHKPLPTVLSKYRRALSKLRQLLQEEEA